MNLFGFTIARNADVIGDNNGIYQTMVLDTIKQSVRYDNKSNVYLAHLHDKKIKIPESARKAIVVDEAIQGKAPIYQIELRTNIMKSMIKSLSREVIDNLNINQVIGAKVSPALVIENNDYAVNIEIDLETAKAIFEKAFIYENVLIVANIKDGHMKFTALAPYRWYRAGDGYVIMNFKDGKVTEEFRNVNFSEFGDLCWEFTLNDSFYDKLEPIFAYETADSAITKEVKVNLSKIFIDKKMFRNNPVEQEVLNLVDVPENVSLANDGLKRASYFDSFQGKNSLSEIIEAKQDKQDSLTNVFKLSAKSLGLKSTGTDFASELPYDNDLTAKTVNDYRTQLSDLLTLIASELTNKEYLVVLGKYELTSMTAIATVNQTALQSGQMSIHSAVARLYPELEDSQIEMEVVRIKIDNPKYEMTLKEHALAETLGWLPKTPDSQVGDLVQGEDNAIL